MSYQNVKDYRTRLKERAVYVMGGKCQCCGYNKVNTALEFHHLDPAQKEFSFGANTNKSWNTVRNELKKCILVCANCHREIHSNLIDDSLLTSSFSEEKAQEIDKLVVQIKEKQIFYCVKCGVEVSKEGNLCPTCAAIQKRIINRPNREELKDLIRNNSFTQIGRMFNVSDNAIRKWCKAVFLPYTVSEINKYTDEEWKLI